MLAMYPAMTLFPVRTTHWHRFAKPTPHKTKQTRMFIESFCYTPPACQIAMLPDPILDCQTAILPHCQHDMLPLCQTARLTYCHIARAADGQTARLPSCHADRLAGCQIGKCPHCQIDMLPWADLALVAETGRGLGGFPDTQLSLVAETVP